MRKLQTDSPCGYCGFWVKYSIILEGMVGFEDRLHLCCIWFQGKTANEKTDDRTCSVCGGV